MGREYTPIPHEYLEEMDCLSDAEYGRLIRGLQKYSITGEEPKLSGQEKVYWKRVRNRENRYQESFGEQEKAKTERAKTAANARWSNAKASTSMRKDAQACTSIPSNAKNAKTNTNTKTNTKTESKTKDIFAAFAAGDVVLMESLLAFEKMRKEIKKPLTDRAKTGICSNLQKLAGDDKGLMAKILDQSTLHCWQDVYALRQKDCGFASKLDIPKGASGELGEAEFEAIQRILQEDLP